MYRLVNQSTFHFHSAKERMGVGAKVIEFAAPYSSKFATQKVPNATIKKEKVT